MITVRPMPIDRAERILVEQIPSRIDRLSEQIGASAVMLHRHRRTATRAEFERMELVLRALCNELGTLAAACPSSRPAKGAE